MELYLGDHIMVDEIGMEFMMKFRYVKCMHKASGRKKTCRRPRRRWKGNIPYL
jgi:hypothetical protein